MKRNQKTALLADLLSGKATAKQITDFQESQKPVEVTLDLGGNDRLAATAKQPTFRIDVHEDGTTESYYRHADGSKTTSL